MSKTEELVFTCTVFLGQMKKKIPFKTDAQ